MNHYDRYARYKPPLPPPPDGQRLQSRRRPIGKSALSRAFVQQLETHCSESRLLAGLALARAGRICHIDISDDGYITAIAVGSDTYQLKLQLKPLPSAVLEQILDLVKNDQHLAERFEYTSALGEFETLLTAAGADMEEGLIPADLALAECSCPYGWGCKHQAGLSYLIAEMLDDDPLLILSLRGISHQRLHQSLTETGATGVQIVSPITFFCSPSPLPTINMPLADHNARQKQLVEIETELSPSIVDAVLNLLDIISAAACSTPIKDVAAEFE